MMSDPQHPLGDNGRKADVNMNRSGLRLLSHETLVLVCADLMVDVKRLRAALGYIAEPDDLLDANEGAFNVHAARRMQAQAQAALSDAEGSDA